MAEYKNLVGRAGRLGYAERGASYLIATSPHEEHQYWEHYIDILIIDGGSILLLQPETDTGRKWLEENVGHDNGYQPYYPTILTEPRYTMAIVLVARRDGLVVEAQS